MSPTPANSDTTTGTRAPRTGATRLGSELGSESGSELVTLVAMRPPRSKMQREGLVNLLGFSQTELLAWVREHVPSMKPYRANQLFRWLHRERVATFDEMTNLRLEERERLKQIACIERLNVATVLRAADGTRKLRLRTKDGHSIESVLIPNDERGATLCISSQVGCALTCRFCATASLGFERNLNTDEIVDQVYRAIAVLEQDAGDSEQEPRPITNLVFMGMGEPLHNFNQVARAIAVLTDAHGLGLGRRRITVSTSGLVPAIQRFGREGLAAEVGLAISLNATTDATRDQVMPINTRWPIQELLAAVRELPLNRRQRVTFEYVLLAGVNDTDADADRLVALLKDLHCHVNLIPFNPHEHAPYKRPSASRVDAFHRRVRDAGLMVWIRTPRGDDIGAACGQLALSEHATPA